MPNSQPRSVPGQPHCHFATIDSTNEEALRRGRDGAPHFALVTANAQTAGRGRRGRNWSSPPGKGLYLSLIVRPGTARNFDFHLLPCLNFAACLAATRAVRELTGRTCHTKWPNDVLIGGRKIAGVLSEAVWREGALDFAVIGLGLNVNHAPNDLPPRPLYPASSLFIETGQEWDVSILREAWLKKFATIYRRLERGDWDYIRDEFWRRCVQRGQNVTINSEAGEVSGTALALAGDGALLLESDTSVRRILAGDILISHGENLATD